MPQFNMSKDGVMRTSVNVTIKMRLTEAEYAEVNRKAKALGYESFRDFCDMRMPHPLVELDDDYSQAEAAGDLEETQS